MGGGFGGSEEVEGWVCVGGLVGFDGWERYGWLKGGGGVALLACAGGGARGVEKG